MTKREEAKRTEEDLAYWEAIFKPIGYVVIGWSYRHTAQVRKGDDYISVDRKIVDLVESAKKIAT